MFSCEWHLWQVSKYYLIRENHVLGVVSARMNVTEPYAGDWKGSRREDGIEDGYPEDEILDEGEDGMLE